LLEVINLLLFPTYNVVLALSTGLRFWFSVPLTIASAVVALSASFIAFGSDVILQLLKRRRFHHFLPLNSSSEDDSYIDDESSVDLMSRRSSTHTGESQSSSTRAELEALLLGSEDQPDLLGDSWAKKYIATKLLWTFWYSCTTEGFVKGFCLGAVFITMHYTGSKYSSESGLIYFSVRHAF